MPEKQGNCSIVAHSLQAGLQRLLNSILDTQREKVEKIWAGRGLLGATSQISGTGTLLRSLGVRFYLELTQSRPALPNPTPPSSPQHSSLLMTGYGLLALLPHSAP